MNLQYKNKILNILEQENIKYKLENIDNEEYIIISNNRSSCALQVDVDKYILYDIEYDFDCSTTFLYIGKYFEFDTNLEEILRCINCLIKDILIKDILKLYKQVLLENGKLAKLKEIFLEKGYSVLSIKDKFYSIEQEYILFSKDGLKWGAISYKYDEYEYSYVFSSYAEDQTLKMVDFFREVNFDFNKANKLLENFYDEELNLP